MSHQEELIYRFTAQTEFATGYSALYANLFEIIGNLIKTADDHPNSIGRWLIEVSSKRNPFDVTLLTLAGLHEAVLSQHPATKELAAYYPSAGGTKSADDSLPAILEKAMAQLKEPVGHVIKTATVQTNETARGSIWLLPMAFCNWPAIELLDLGASAGLNLLANQRLFEFIDAETGKPLVKLGSGQAEGLVVKTTGDFEPLTQIKPSHQFPDIVARSGVDLNPFPIDGKTSEVRLTSYIWPDQAERIQRLDRALGILRKNKQSAAPVQLDGVNLPSELPPYLAKLVPSDVPLVIYNTYITQYFKDDRPELDAAVAEWAQTQNRPVLWLQWEPHVDWAGESTTAAEYGWCAWTADVWLPSAADGNQTSASDLRQAGGHRRFLLGWVHPHGLQARFLPGLADWAEFFSDKQV